MAKQYPSQKNSHEPTNVLVKFSYMKTLHFETAIFLVLVRPQRLVYKQKKQKKSLRSSKYKNIKTQVVNQNIFRKPNHAAILTLDGNENGIVLGSLR